MRFSNPNYRCAWHFLDALAQAGLRHACICPGYLNSPLLLMTAEHPGIANHVFHDERAAAFAGVGLARAADEPVAVMVTAGTAAAEVHAAVVEAWQSRIPVLFLTADRPHELRDVGERQSIDQVQLFGRAVKWYHEAALPSAAPDLAAYVRALALRAWGEVIEPPRGPVHVNFPFREPLPPIAAPAGGAGVAQEHAHVTRYFPGRVAPGDAAIATTAELVAGRRAMIVAGELRNRRDAAAVLSLAGAGGFPVFADPLSYLRAGRHDAGSLFYLSEPGVGAVDARTVITRALGLSPEEEPEIVIRFGAPPVSKALNAWLASRRAMPQIVVDDGRWRDPAALATAVVRGEPAAVASALAHALRAPAPRAWTERWRRHLARRKEEIARALAAEVTFPSEPGAVLALAEAAPEGSRIVVGASMPIRDVDGFFPFVGREIAILSNRGASGIDGLLATAVGTALADPARPAYVLAGDLSVLHDLGSLRAAVLHRVAVTFVVLNNDGGGIFHFVPQVSYPHFESHVATPHGTKFAPVAQALGIPAHVVERREELVRRIADPPAGPQLLEIVTDRHENARLHERLWKALGC
ncbi:MAG: 2-succinyl-5-enolpyruvyl-6-hydroxy-3-cyclohexene-1-carboxylic-acid synthase [Burkholderiales bacterium]|nr:2-succinyl-5-enolpyruvyl-6-hydroxy-3-cyclohexene-1-carboxylic-acid synthase [Burkholderiales bacterium]